MRPSRRMQIRDAHFIEQMGWVAHNLPIYGIGEAKSGEFARTADRNF